MLIFYTAVHFCMNTVWTAVLSRLYTQTFFYVAKKVENMLNKLEYLDQVLKRKIGSLLYIRLCVSVFCTDTQTKKDRKWVGVLYSSEDQVFMLLLLFFVIEVGFNPCQHGV